MRGCTGSAWYRSNPGTCATADEAYGSHPAHEVQIIQIIQMRDLSSLKDLDNHVGLDFPSEVIFLGVCWLSLLRASRRAVVRRAMLRAPWVGPVQVLVPWLLISRRRLSESPTAADHMQYKNRFIVPSGAVLVLICMIVYTSSRHLKRLERQSGIIHAQDKKRTLEFMILWRRVSCGARLRKLFARVEGPGGRNYRYK